MTVPLQWLRLGSAACAAIAVFASICGVATNSDGLGYRLWSSYVGHLDRALRIEHGGGHQGTMLGESKG